MTGSQTAGPAGNWLSFYPYYYFPGILGLNYYSQQIGKFNGQEGYIGVRFLIGPNTHYGWIRFRGAADNSSGTIIDWAYEDVAGAPIHLQAPPAPVPTLNEWGVIILMGLILMEGTRRLKRKMEEGQ